jgi:hypothetical protein
MAAGEMVVVARQVRLPLSVFRLWPAPPQPADDDVEPERSIEPRSRKRDVAAWPHWRDATSSGPLSNFAQTPLSRRSGRSRPPSTALEQWTGRRACSPPQVDQAFHVRPRQLRPATFASHPCRLISKPQRSAEDLQLLHQMCRRTLFTPPLTRRAFRGKF